MPGTVLNREALFVALFATLQTALGFPFSSRFWQPWDATPPDVTPAFYLIKGPELSDPAPADLPDKRRITARLVMYFQGVSDDSVPPSTQINVALDAIDATLVANPAETVNPLARFPMQPTNMKTTLGGLVNAVSISGTIEVLEGIVGGGALAFVDILMDTTA